MDGVAKPPLVDATCQSIREFIHHFYFLIGTRRSLELMSSQTPMR